MARTTHTERGAKIALEIAQTKRIQRDLFPSRRAPSLKFWRDVERIAEEQLQECRALREARA